MRQSMILAILIFAANTVHADTSANFTVEGEITGSTCKVDLGANNTVSLPVQKRSVLAKAGDTAGKTPFQISVIGCSANASLYFENDQATVNSEGRLVNTALPGEDAGAQNVELEILNESGLPVKLASSKGQQSVSAATLGATPDAAIYNFFVQYYAVGVAQAGTVKSSLTFLVDSF